MKKILYVILTTTIILSGCSKNIRPKKVIKTDFSNSQAEVIMKRTWEPIYQMKDDNGEIKPDAKISSREEFYEIYDFSFMGDLMTSMMYETIVDSIYDEETKTEKDPKDNEGYVIFKGNKYIPTIYDEGVFIKEAYLRDSKYSEKYSGLDIVELIVVEDSNEKVSDYAAGFIRKNIFRKDDNEEWILYSIEGTISISW